MYINTFLLLLLLPTLLFAGAEEKTAFIQGLKECEYYTTDQGNILRYTCFKTPVKTNVQDLVFIQGRGTFLEFYEVLIVPLLERGFNVWTYDLTGQGGSSRLLNSKHHDPLSIQYLQHIDSFDTYLEDMDSFLSNIVLKNCDGKIILGGYSTGGHLVLRYAMNYKNSHLKSIFTISPLINLKTPIPNCFLSSIFWTASWIIDLKRYLPGSNHEDPIYQMHYLENPYTSDEKAFQEMIRLCKENPSHMMGGASIGWVNAALDSVNMLWKNETLDNIQVPVLIATGGEDGVVDVSYNEIFSNALKQSKHLYYKNARHELFREEKEIRDAWWKDFDAFISEML